MPKIIENPETKLLAEAKRQVELNGYSATTIRSVAKGCGMGVGTVYNYFASKDALLAAYLLRDWQVCIATIAKVSSAADAPGDVARCIYQQLQDFSQRHASIFQDEAAAAGFSGSFSRYHALLRSQLAAPLRKFCKDDFAAEFIAESLLTWTMAGTDFDQIYGILHRLF